VRATGTPQERRTRPYFRDRTDAGRQLADRVRRLAGERCVVLALPRGGVPVGFEIARALPAPLDVIVARKIGAPFNPEYGIGAVAPGGVRVVDEDAVRALDVQPQVLDQLSRAATDEMNRRIEKYRGGKPPIPLEDTTAILVDDGVATGVTARAAVKSVRLHKPRRVVVAVPVSSVEAGQLLEREADEFVALATPRDFMAVGMWYADFEQTSDEEVVALLEQGRVAAGAGHPGVQG
jgi:putative phosphoribosyl transferase